MRSLEEELDKVLFDTYSLRLKSEYHATKALGDFSIGRQVIRRVKYADGLVLMSEEEAVLQGMFDGLIETGR
jgi:hypothetical protein